MAKTSPTLELLEAQAEKLGILPKKSAPLWPAEYCTIDADTAYRFVTECVRTYDENDPSSFELIPALPYVRTVCEEWVKCYLEGRPLHIVKSRRLVVSWLIGALELWIAGIRGGTYAITAEAYETANGACGFVWRRKFMYDQLRSRFNGLDGAANWSLPECKGIGGEGSDQNKMVELANGAIFKAVNSSSGTFQGAGATYVLLEELSQYRFVNGIVAQAATVVEGKGGAVPGLVASISNAAPSPEWLDLIKPHGPDYVLSHGKCIARDGENGCRVVEIHYACDPSKAHPDWVLARRGKRIPEREWQREYEGCITVFDGEPVYAGYSKEIHEGVIDFPRSHDPGVLILSMDCGNTLSPAAVLGFVDQCGPTASQVQVLMEIIGPGMHMAEFAPYVAQRLDQQWPSWRLWENRMVCVGDPSGASRQGNTGKSAFDIAREYGFNLKKSQNALQGRLSCVTRMLMGWAVESKCPLMVFNRALCPVLCEGMAGGYSYRDNREVGNRRSLREPKKDGYSHPCDAHQYLCLEAARHLEGHESVGYVDRVSNKRASAQSKVRYV